MKFDADLDIAIFRRKEAEGHNICGLTLNQLGLASLDRSNFPVQTIAYSSYNSPLGSVLGKTLQTKKTEPQEARCKEIMLKKPTTIFEYITYGYFESLAATREGSYIMGKIRPDEASRSDHAHQLSTSGKSDIIEMAEKMPLFYRLFKPDEKALAVGRVLSRDDQSELLQLPTPQGQHQGSPPAYSELRVHTISGYFRCSGAMIATFDEMENPRVVGIYKP